MIDAQWLTFRRANMTWKVEIKEYHAVANWTWDAGDDVCSICRMPFDGCPPDCKVSCLAGCSLG